MELREKSDLQIAHEAVAGCTTRGIDLSQITGEMSLRDDLGIDSLRFIRLILEIESRIARPVFNIQLIAHIKTVADLCSAVSQSSGNSTAL